MSKCDRCGVELIEGTKSPWESGGDFVHTPERCRDRLAARLAEATRALGDAHHVLGNCEDHQVFAAKCARCIIEKALGYT